MRNILKSNPEIWDLFTRKEEYTPLLNDQYGRFPYYLSKNKSIFDPIVSKFLIEKGVNLKLRDDKKFAVCLTHDIDYVYPYRGIKRITKGTLNHMIDGKIYEGLKIPFSKIKRDWNSLWNFDNIVQLEKKYEAKSTFYILMPNENGSSPDYNIKELEQPLKSIVDNGWEVGMHGDFKKNDLHQMIKEKLDLEEIIGESILGYRSHFLKFQIPEFWVNLYNAGFKYDTSLGYADCVGFRNGMCHPFKPFNLSTESEIDICEIPLTIMDGSLFNYMQLDLTEAWKITKILIDKVEEVNGVFTLLWHNTYMFDDKLKFYEKILKYCSEKNAWMTSGKEIYETWNKNGVVKDV